MELLQREYIYPNGMQTHHNEEVYYDHASGKPFKELYPSMYKEGWAFIGIFVCDHFQRLVVIISRNSEE